MISLLLYELIKSGSILPSKYNHWKVMVKLIFFRYFDNQSFAYSNSKSCDLFSNIEELNNCYVGHPEEKDECCIDYYTEI